MSQAPLPTQLLPEAVQRPSRTSRSTTALRCPRARLHERLAGVAAPDDAAAADRRTGRAPTLAVSFPAIVVATRRD